MKSLKFAFVFMLACAILPQVRADDTGLLVPSPSSLEAIHHAVNLSEAVEAYSKAVADVRDPSMAQRAFISKMIELETPQVAEKQAKDLTEFVPDGVAWAVQAFASGHSGELDPAMAQEAKAIKYSPGDAFVQKTAGQLLAWYDIKIDPNNVSDTTKQTAESIRKAMNSRREFAKAYDDAKSILDNSDPAPIYVVSSPSAYSAPYPVADNRQIGPELSLFWDSPYLYPHPYGYGYGYGGFGGYGGYGGYGYGGYGYPGRYISGSAFPQVWVRNVDIGTRYIRLPGNNGFILDGTSGTTIVGTPDYYYPSYYPGFVTPWYPTYNRPFYGGARYGAFGAFYGGWQTPGVGVGQSRLSNRMCAGSGLVPGSFGPQPVLVGGNMQNAPARSGGGRGGR